MSNRQFSPAQFITLVSVFFFWGFVAASNDILIPVFENNLDLEHWQSQLISFAFYIAYTVGALAYQLFSKLSGRDLLNRIGYKNGIALGLLISASGTLLFIPAANQSSFFIMITGLFVVGLGFSLQQTAANPLAINMGHPSRGAQRLSMAGGINNIGTTIGPILLSMAIFGSVSAANTQADISNIKTPYLILGLAFVLVAALFKFSSIPNQLESATTGSKEPADVLDAPSATEKRNALSYPQLWLGMIGIFVYVGVEVSTAGNLPKFLQHRIGMGDNELAPFVSLFWASLMVGRWAAAAGVFTQNVVWKRALSVLLPFLAYLLFIAVNHISGHDTSFFRFYPLVILVLIAADFASRGNPARQLLLFSLLGIASLLTGILSPNAMVSAYAFISVGLFCSTLWPCIFTLAIAGLGRYTNQGSGFLVMMIMGGGIISLLQGFLAHDSLLGIQWSFLVGVACFVYLAWYAWRATSLLKKQGVSLDAETASGH